MRFADLTAGGELSQVFAGMVDCGKLPHAILLHEDDGGGAVPFALSVLQYLYCGNHSEGDSCGECPSCRKISKMIHPDVHFIYPVTSGNLSISHIAEWREMVHSNPNFTEADLNEALAVQTKSTLIAVSEANAILSTLSFSALEGGYRSVVIYLPEKMNQEAANRLLKMIEEPPSLTLFVLVTHSPENVLQTIRSRCQTFRVIPSGREVEVDSEFVGIFNALMESLCEKDLLKSLDLVNALCALPSRENAKAFCKFASAQMRDIFMAQQGMPGATSVWAGRCRMTFPRKALEVFDRTSLLIDRNVNQKILFTDLIDRLTMIY